MSSRISGRPVPAPPEKPPRVEAPGTTISIAEPIDAICAAMSLRAPSPMTTVVISAATPIITPSAVSVERKRLRIRARSASRRAISNMGRT